MIRDYIVESFGTYGNAVEALWMEKISNKTLNQF